MKILFTGMLLFLLNSVVAQANWQINLDILDHSLKKNNESLKLQLEIQSSDKSKADLYVAVQSPDSSLLFIQAPNLFSESVNFSTTPVAYATNISANQGVSGRVLTIPQLPANLPAGQYHLYAVITQAGADVFQQNLWQTPLAHDSFLYVNNANFLAIPQQLTGVINEQGQKVFDLTLQKGQKSFLPDTQTATYGINGHYLGPTLRVSRGDKLAFNISNQLDEPSTIHWHGAHIPAKMDGGPHQIIEQGSTWKPFFEIKQAAATLWYHPHLEGKTAEQVYKGLAGLIIIDDSVSDSLALPNRYGEDDIPMVVQDRRIADNGDMSSQLKNMTDVMGLRGKYMLVNGDITPTLESHAQVIRLRILNGSNARIYNFGFADNHEFYQIATDGGLLTRPVPLTRMHLAPGERAEILLDLRTDSGQYLLLQSFSAELSPLTLKNAMMRDALDMQTFDIMSIRVGQAGDNNLSIPATLTTIEQIPVENAVVNRPFVLQEGRMNNSMGDMGDMNNSMGGMGDMNNSMGGMGGMIGANNTETFANLSNMGMFRINDKVMDRERVDETIRLGDTEIWTISNEADMAHPFHIHDIQFLILDRNGQKPAPEEAGWKDTVLVFPDETVRVITRFEDFADPDVPYMYHCHILEHEDAGMMGQFVVIP
ncbi:MAG: blue copper oxidase [Methyloprofundus sp.]|nr:MAG: blue copper oxidase [Methyloprofundus sp.]